MPRRQPVEVYQVYLDTTVLVDLANEDAPRHRQARTLVRLFQRYRRPLRPRALQMVTSAWAVAEAHGVLYEMSLKQRGVSPPTRGGRVAGSVRHVIPPSVPDLQVASQQLESVLTTLQATTSFLLLDDTSPGAAQVWQLANRLGQEAAIYPADSVHLALALKTGCAMLITDDGDFLDKIEYCDKTIIQPYRATEFSYIPTLPPFQFCGVRESRSITPGRTQPVRPGAVATLNRSGFRFR